jgi:hypothetical protein
LEEGEGEGRGVGRGEKHGEAKLAEIVEGLRER